MTAKLSGLNHLIEDARAGSQEARSALLRDLIETYMEQPNALTRNIREEFGEILAALYGLATDATQREIAEKLIPSPAAPPALLIAFAHCKPHIAAPALRAAMGFTDAMLVDVIKQGEEFRLSAIAQRKQISEGVSDALIARANTASLVMLAKNQGATISTASMGRMIALARRCPELQKPLIARFDLSPYLLIRMFFFISPELRKEILCRAEAIEPALVREAMDAIREALMAPSEEDSAEMEEARRLVAEKAIDSGVNESFLSDLLKAGESASVVCAFAWITGVDARAVKTMFKDASLESLVVACRGSSLSKETFSALVKSMAKSHQGGDVRTPVMLDLYERISPDIAEKLMRFWRLRARAAADAAKIASLLQGVEGLSADRVNAG